jgi:hypothetical protein
MLSDVQLALPSAASVAPLSPASPTVDESPPDAESVFIESPFIAESPLIVASAPLSLLPPLEAPPEEEDDEPPSEPLSAPLTMALVSEPPQPIALPTTTVPLTAARPIHRHKHHD